MRYCIASLGTRATSTAARRVAEATSRLGGAPTRLVAPSRLMARALWHPHAVWHAAAQSSSPPRVACSGRTRSGDDMHYVMHSVMA